MARYDGSEIAAGLLASGAPRAYPYYNPEDAVFVAPAVIRVGRK